MIEFKNTTNEDPYFLYVNEVCINGNLEIGIDSVYECVSASIDKQNAIDIIEHLQKVFNLNIDI